jgi:putative transposase
MPRLARLDAPGTVHHLIVRGIEKRAIVTDLADREEFVSRMGKAAIATGTTIFAWALLPNHAHILIRSGPTGLPVFMRKFLTGYAIRYNRRHRRHGHLFQNRYKSIVCDEDAYFCELVRYIHLNPLRARLVESLDQLDRYPWCGHAVLLGKTLNTWLDRRYVLSWFGERERNAMRAYREYVEQGIPLGRRSELVGGGLIRSLGGWSQVRSRRASGATVRADERILGSGEFVERVLAEAEEQVRAQVPLDRKRGQVQEFIEKRCAECGVNVVELRGGSRRGPVAHLRAELARSLVVEFGLPMAEAGRQLGVTTSGIARALARTGGI